MDIGNMNYSVLMAVYHKDNPAHFEVAIDSILEQTILTNDFVIVCDGPLNSQLDAILNQKVTNCNFLNVVRLEKNVGLGKALNIGIKECKNELIARMDSDDISLPFRCERQLELFKENEKLAISSATIEEYDLEYKKRLNTKKLPETNKQILKYYTKRNPFNHPVVMYRKDAVIDAGSYDDFWLLEDYYLWIRMINKGYEGYNLKEVLLHMRTGENMIKRRGGWKYFKSNVKLQKYLLNRKNIGFAVFLYHVIIRFIVQVLTPTRLRSLFYRGFLRK